MNRSAREFLKLLADFRSVLGLAGKGLLVAPVITLITTIGPPWPSRSAVVVLTSFAELAVLAYVFEFLSNASPARNRRLMQLLAVPFALVFVWYLLLFSAFVFDAPDAWHRDVKGFRYDAAAASIIDEAYPEPIAIKAAGYDPTKIWTAASVYTNRVVILVLWLGLFAVASAYFSVFVLLNPSTGRPVPSRARVAVGHGDKAL